MAAAATTNQAQATKVVTGKVRLGYVHVFEPYTSDPDNPPKYSVVIMVPKSDKATIRKLRKAQQAALENGKEKTFGGKLPKEWHDTIKDGDEDADLDKNPEYEGHLYFQASAKNRPGIVDRSLNEIINSSEVYSGCYARVSINAFPYNTRGNKGVSFGLNHIQKVADGEFFGGRSKAEDDFDELDDEDEDEDDDLI